MIVCVCGVGRVWRPRRRCIRHAVTRLSCSTHEGRQDGKGGRERQASSRYHCTARQGGSGRMSAEGSRGRGRAGEWERRKRPLHTGAAAPLDLFPSDVHVSGACIHATRGPVGPAVRRRGASKMGSSGRYEDHLPRRYTYSLERKRKEGSYCRHPWPQWARFDGCPALRGRAWLPRL